MADELVYRLILDGQDNTSGPSQGASSGTRSAARNANDDQTTQNIIALEQARARIRREDAMELADQQYRSIKKGLPLSRIQDQDRDAKSDAAVAEKERVKEEARKEAEAQRKAMDRVRIQGEERQRRDEDWLAHEEQRLQKEKQAQQVRGEERQNRDEDWLARDQMKQQREADTRAEEAAKEAERQRKLAQSIDPVFLSNQAIEREKLYERTRLQMEATKRGMTPEQIANEERARETARNAAGYAQAGTGFLRQAGSGPMGLANAIGGLNPITGPITQALTGVASSLKQYHDEMRPILLQVARFSPEVITGNIQNKIAALRQDLQISKEKGGQIAAKEKENAFWDRANKDIDVDVALNGPMANINRELELQKLGWKGFLRGDLGKPKPWRGLGERLKNQQPEQPVPLAPQDANDARLKRIDLDWERNKWRDNFMDMLQEAMGGEVFDQRAANRRANLREMDQLIAERRNILKPPGPFEFRVQRLGAGVGGPASVGAAIPFFPPKPMRNVQMPGG